MEAPKPQCLHEYDKDCAKCVANMEALRDLFFYEPEHTLDELDAFDF